MPAIDNAEAIRARAYEIWEREGCPSGREHEHWAEANAEFEALARAELAGTPAAPPTVAHRDIETLERCEAERLREALWTPEPFAVELFGRESPLLAGATEREYRLAS
ncbi:DUF2934 domain-containing protein [Aurantimonas sp. Leaf443]|uniref:DUF2934 domain-containing protein n=1 Tax=Aurantimonas sp. Leaf443 TaxID=1736378 RepID=UPI0007006395|nr:DUF2934 domain-containing protein [Aurantimonas sp. Leaf443]KQT85306.1 hypothetical protein ASG48_08615 [Aurantimonas sp. Leaf443]